MKENILKYPGHQRGIATLLILLLVGMAISVAIFGSLSYLQGSQNQSIVLHTQTEAQMKAWLGVDVVYQYLNALEEEKLEDLLNEIYNKDDPDRSPVKIDSNDLAKLNLEAVFEYKIEESNEDNELISTLIYTTIEAKARESSRAESTSAIQAVYLISDENESNSAGGDGSTPDPRVINFRDGLDLSDGIRVYTKPGDAYHIYVDGNVTIGGIGLSGIDTIRSTKSIKYQGGSSTNFAEMHANCDIQVSNGVFSVGEIKATRNVCLADTISSNLIAANGSVEVSGGTHGDIYAHANNPAVIAQCESGATQYCASHGSSLPSGFGIKTNPAPTINAIYSKADIELKSSVAVGVVRAERHLNVTQCEPSWINAYYGVSYSKSGCPSLSLVATQLAGSLTFPVVHPVEMEPEVFDANTLRSAANYIYYRKDNLTRVKIKGVEGIPDYTDAANPAEVRQNGYYYRTARLIQPGGNEWWTPTKTFSNYICINSVTLPDGQGEADGVCHARLGKAYDVDNGILPTYSNGKWIFNGNDHAPGVIFVEGDLEVGNGTYTNTFIATGNIQVISAGGAVFSLNYAGANGITAGGHTAIGVCNNTHYTVKPTAFCNDAYNHAAHSGVGNYALLAGSCPDPSGSVDGCGKNEYVGGNIIVERSVFGVVQAGNIFESKGDTKIYGYVTALGQRNTSTTIFNKMSERTELYLDVSPTIDDRYDPSGGGLVSGNGSNGSSKDLRVSVLWTRYL